ncbi:hypothetical protein [Streptomyces sp. NPDC008240]|uniref:hypothetical protein n=1 Tax=Streptomyces sp. NPDC008240 TaxID=3364822 RepID=UPI0036E76D4A
MIWLALAAALAVGYILGRVQPYTRLADWANWELRWHADRWLSSRLRQTALLGLLLVTAPVNTVRVWRQRKDPRP